MTETKIATEFDRIRQAYCAMAREASYRPAAPGDGFGSIDLSLEDLHDPEILEKESAVYAARFIREENTNHYFIGCANWSTNRALVYTIEAARLLCGGMDDERAVKLLRMAAHEIKRSCPSAMLHARALSPHPHPSVRNRRMRR